jgi:peroxiredoxin
MTALQFAARLWLALLFAVAAGSKMLDRAAFRRALTDFGIPPAVLGLFAVGLPIVELTIAAALVAKPTAGPAAIVALGLLFLFTVAVSATLVRGRRPPCHCFGQIDSDPISARTIVRNIVLMLLAGFIAWRDYGYEVGWSTPLGNDEGLAAIGSAVVVAYLLAIRAKSRATRASSLPTAGLPVGHRAPDFSLAGLNGETQTLQSLLAPGKPLLLAFAEPGCDLCDHLLPDLARWQRESAAKTTFAVLSAGSPAENRSRPAALLLENVLLQANREVADAYLVKYSPAVVLVRPDGTIGAPAAVGQQEIERLVQRLK